MSKRYILHQKLYQAFTPETVLADFQRPRISLVSTEFSASLLATAINGAVVYRLSFGFIQRISRNKFYSK